MEASPAPMAILHSIRIQKLLAKAQPTEEMVKIAIPQPARRWHVLPWLTQRCIELKHGILPWDGLAVG